MQTGRLPAGRPRDGRVDAAVLAATRELLAERGYAAVTVDAVAARAGVGKAAIYRRMRSRTELLFAAAVHDLELPEPPDTGSLAGDVAGLLDSVVRAVTNPAAGRVLPHLFAEFARDRELAARYERTFLRHELASVRAVVDRAVARGEIAAAPPLDGVHALVLGPVLARLVTGRPVEPAAVRTHAALLVAALRGYPAAAADGARGDGSRGTGSGERRRPPHGGTAAAGATAVSPT